MAVAALVITLPALKGNSAGDPFPFAFFAVVSITVIGLYIAYAIPIYLRWRAGSAFEQSPVWNLGNKWRWMNPFAVFWVGLITIIFCLPFTPAAVPWNDEFSWEALNYAPLTVGAVILFAAIAWKRGRQATTSPARPEHRHRRGADRAKGTSPRRARNVSRVTLDELKQAVADGTVDTVLLAIADMEGRLQGKRLTASHFLADTLEHGAEGCNYLLAVDVDMETVGGYAMSSWERGYGDFEMVPDLDTLRPVPVARGHGDAARRPAVGRRLRGGRLAAPDPAPPARPARRARAGSPTPAPSSSSSSSRTPTRRPGRRPTATSSRPTSTTSTTRCSARRASSR